MFMSAEDEVEVEPSPVLRRGMARSTNAKQRSYGATEASWSIDRFIPLADPSFSRIPAQTVGNFYRINQKTLCNGVFVGRCFFYSIERK
jgi:hypothetical protein